MAHADHRHLHRQLGAQLLGSGTDPCIVFTHTGHQFAVLVLKALTRLGLTDITITQVGHGTNDRFWLPVGVFQHNHLIGRVLAGRTHHMHIQHLEQLRRGVEETGRIVIAPDNDHMTTAGSRHPVEEAVIQRLCPVAGGGGIEEITGDQQYIYRLLNDLHQHPVEKCLELLVTLLAIEQTAQMPVGTVQDAQRSSGCMRCDR